MHVLLLPHAWSPVPPPDGAVAAISSNQVAATNQLLLRLLLLVVMTCHCHTHRVCVCRVIHARSCLLVSLLVSRRYWWFWWAAAVVVVRLCWLLLLVAAVLTCRPLLLVFMWEGHQTDRVHLGVEAYACGINHACQLLCAFQQQRHKAMLRQVRHRLRRHSSITGTAPAYKSVHQRHIHAVGHTHTVLVAGLLHAKLYTHRWHTQP